MSAELVLRRPPFGIVAPGAHDMGREYRVLSRAVAGHTTAPLVRSCCCDDHDVVGADFVVVEYRVGEVVWAQLPPSMADARRRRPAHRVRRRRRPRRSAPRSTRQACDLGDLGRPDGFLDRQVARVAQAMGSGRQRRSTRRRWTRSPSDSPVAMPESSTAAPVLHNDFKLDNCQFASRPSPIG